MTLPAPFNRLSLACLLLLAAAGPLHAAPETPPGDAVLQLLQERGLLPTAGQARLSACAAVAQPGSLIFSGLALAPLTTAPLAMLSRM